VDVIKLGRFVTSREFVGCKQWQIQYCYMELRYGHWLKSEQNNIRGVSQPICHTLGSESEPMSSKNR
jgi:hypothetical protein